jgi:DNA polymerase-1
MVVDGHSLAFRAFYALPVDSFVTRDGQHTNAIHGFISMLINLLANEKPTHVAVAFDISRYSFRTREYPEYKGTRDATPAEFVGQVPLLEEALHAMSIPTLSKEDFEADDILATLAHRGSEEGFKVFVVSGDRDAIQMINDNVTLLYPNARGVSELKRYDRDTVFERYGIEPHQYPDIAALVGETSDNLIGVDKVGEKTAVKWINQYGSLTGVLEHADEIGGVVGQNLRDQKDRAVRNRKLNHLLTDVDLPFGPSDLERKPMNIPAIRDVFDRLQFRTLQERVLKIAAQDGANDDITQELLDDAGTGAPPVRTMVDEELAKWLDTHSKQGTAPLALRVESISGQVTGLGIASETESAFVPWAAGRPDYVALEDWMRGPAPKYLFDSKRELKWLQQSGLELNGIQFDTTLAAWLLKPGGKSQDLVDQVYYFLSETIQRADPNQLVPDVEAINPATEAWYVFRLSLYLAERLDTGSLTVLETIELPLVPVLAQMEVTGVTVSASVLGRLNTELRDTANDLAQRAYAEIGHEVNLGSPKQLQQVLFEELNMPKTRSNKTGFSTDAASLADLQDQAPHPFLDLLLQHRDATKLNQIIETLQRGLGSDGRIHTTYDQTGSSTGRISSNDPNLQNIPVKTAVGREIRSAFCVQKNGVQKNGVQKNGVQTNGVQKNGRGSEFETLLTADYSQIEMRIMAHLSGDEGLILAFNEGEDLHRFVGSRIFGVEPADVTPTMRTKVKAMSYGLAYGLSAFGLSKQLRIETAEAKQLMADYFARFGAVREYLRNVVEQARVDGYTETIFGRRRPFGDLTSNNRVLREAAERAALNAPIQGSAADILKIAMLGIADDLRAQELRSNMLLQVHDELVFEVAAGEVDAVTAIVRDRMGHAAELRVPLDVQIGTGENWDQAAH